MKVGDLVRVTNWGGSFTTNNAWFLDHVHDLDVNYLIRYAYNDSTNYLERKNNDDRIFEVLYVDDALAPNALITLATDLMTYNDDDYKKVFLIGCRDLELVNKPEKRAMTLKEIEEELGYKVSIISE